MNKMRVATPTPQKTTTKKQPTGQKKTINKQKKNRYIEFFVEFLYVILLQSYHNGLQMDKDIQPNSEISSS